MKKILAIGLSLIIAVSGLGILATPVEAYTDSSLGSKYIDKIGNGKKTVYKGNEFELEVRKGKKVRENDIRWSIGNTSIVKFDDDDRTDDEIELKAVGVGTTKVYAKNLITGGTLVHTITVKNPTGYIYKVGNSSKSVTVGNDLELKVEKPGLRENQVKWSIGNTSILKFEDGDNIGEEVEVIAKKKGTTKVYAKNLRTGGTIVYTVTVKNISGYIYKVGNSTKSVKVGNDLELEVDKPGLNENQVKWSIGNTSILKFEDGDNIGEEVEVIGKKKGTAKVYAKNLRTGGTIVYTVNVV